MAKDKRFIKTYSQGAGSTEIWVDRETGVNSLYEFRTKEVALRIQEHNKTVI